MKRDMLLIANSQTILMISQAINYEDSFHLEGKKKTYVHKEMDFNLIYEPEQIY